MIKLWNWSNAYANNKIVKFMKPLINNKWFFTSTSTWTKSVKVGGHHTTVSVDITMFVSFRSIYCLLITQVLPATVKPALWKIQLSCWKRPWSPFRASVSFFLFNVSSLLLLLLLLVLRLLVLLVLVLFIFNIYFQETTTDIFLLSMNRDGRPLAGLESDNRNREEVSMTQILCYCGSLVKTSGSSHCVVDICIRLYFV